MKFTDHDLLQRLDSKVDSLIDEVKEMKSGTISDITDLKKEKADRREVEEIQKKVNEDHEVRIRNIENISNLDSGISKGRVAALMVLSFAVASVLIPLVSAYISRK